MFDIDTLLSLSFGPYRVAMIAYDMFLRLWYYLVIGIVLSAAFTVFVPTGKVNWIFRNAHSLKAIFIASLLGVISPLGSYAVIPIFVSLLGMGIPLAPVMAFLAASPIINPFIFYLTTQMLGLQMALAIVISTFFVGVATGLAFLYLSRFPSFQNNPGTLAFPNFGQASLPSNMKADDDSIPLDAKIEKLAAMMDHKPIGKKWKVFYIQCLKMTKHIGIWFALSIILAAVVDVYIPVDWIVRSLGGHSYSLLLATAMAIPFYVCGGAAIPLVWDLMRTGMDQGAALTFFIAGPVTKIAPMVTVIFLMRYKVFGVYIGVTMVSAIVLGYFYHFV